MIVDCDKVQTHKLDRGDHPIVSTEGVSLLGTRMADEEIFEGDIQQLMIVPDPSAAYDYCTHFMPGCDSALIYAIQPEDLEFPEVRPPGMRENVFDDHV
ncbi:hypothetical protein GDO86_006874 [Hymenochirus boettgeri]|uniref:Uncharacterized protein n=1 Tax=Hymenochirus boettgeri TaxID=247094 RepID=A0A8T2J7T3_9PIPI|nr:hypothetical protein GDO86_006874 [Hymenochirus boettgeri]